MDITPEARQQLRALIEGRALDLKLSLREVAGRAGVSAEALRLLRYGPGGIRPLTARQYDMALEWVPGSLQRLIETGQSPQDILTPAERAAVNGYPLAAAKAAEAQHRRDGKSAG